MTVFVDELKYHRKPARPAKRHGHWWCHLMADTVEELHAFAVKIGLSNRYWFQDHRHPHYDLTAVKRSEAMRAGAQQMSTRSLLKRCQYKKQSSA